jgi:N-acetylglucosamine kinase-like BadF-type ATPase
MANPFYIGVDGGASQSTILLMDKNNSEIIREKKGPTNPFSIGINTTEAVLSTSIKEVAQKAECLLSDCAGICIGSAGIHHPRDAEDLRNRLQNHFQQTPIHVTNDFEIALVGGTGNLEGIIIISGTGSVAYGRSRNNDFVRAGGWGHLIGDEGSAYYIGKQALISIFETCDSNMEQTLLEEMILTGKNCKDLDDLMFWAYKLATKKDIADLSMIVDLAYKKGDVTSLKILLNAGKDLFKLLDNIRGRLPFRNGKIPMLISGGVLLNNALVQSTFLQKALEGYSDISLVTPQNDAAYGAALIAKNTHNIEETKL